MRKGQGLPMSTIVVTALSLLVLVVIGAFFISGMTRQTGAMAGWLKVTGGNETTVKAKCNSLCLDIAGITISSCPTDGRTVIKNTPELKEFYKNVCPCFITCDAVTETVANCRLSAAFGKYLTEDDLRVDLDGSGTIDVPTCAAATCTSAEITAYCTATPTKTKCFVSVCSE